MLITLAEKAAAAMGEKIDAVLETLAYSDEIKIVLGKLPDGKFRATSKSWDEAKVFLPDQVLEVSPPGAGASRARSSSATPVTCGGRPSRCRRTAKSPNSWVLEPQPDLAVTGNGRMRYGVTGSLLQSNRARSHGSLGPPCPIGKPSPQLCRTPGPCRRLRSASR